MRRIGLTLAAVSVVVAILTGLLVRGMSLDSERFDDALSALDRFAAGEATLQRDVLKARAGALRNYDPVVADTDALDGAVDDLMRAASADPRTRAAVEQLAFALARQAALVEAFKSDNALLQNSLAYFKLFSDQVMTSGQDGPGMRGTGALASAMLNLLLDTSPAGAREVADRLDELARSSTGDDTTAALLAHGRLLHDVLPEIDGTLKRLLQVPDASEPQAVRTAIVAARTEVRDSARHVWLVLYAMSLVLLALLVHLGLQLRVRAVRLRRRAAFEHLIAAISSRFIDTARLGIDAPVKEALADLAGHIGADHGYFVMDSRTEGLSAWHHGSGDPPRDWPRQVLDLAGRLKADPAGIIHVRRVGRLPPGPVEKALASAGVTSWVCVPPAGADAVKSVLGFHTLKGGFTAAGDELGVLQTARNTIHGAIRRDLLERARTRLQKRLDQARRMETVGGLASGIAHNFNNIIGAIVGHAAFAEAQLPPDAAAAVTNLDAIRRASERARDLIDRILVFGGSREGHRRRLDAAAVIAEAGSLLRASLPGTVDLVVPRQEPVIVAGEPAALQQVVLNLCNNAAQAMDNCGRVEVTAEVRDLASARRLSHGELVRGRYLCIAVSDTGRGIDAATLGRIFEPFFTTREDGNGLGLATVREIVEDHGGAIAVRSRPGAGSRFEVWLPCAEGGDAGDVDDAVPAGRGETLLVVDDDAERLLRDEDIIAALGYEPLGFTTVTAALAACRSAPQRFDAAIVMLHGRDAEVLEFAAALQAAAPGLAVVVAVSSAADGLADELAGAGVAGIVRRPLDSAEIAAALRRCLAARRDREAVSREVAMPLS